MFHLSADMTFSNLMIIDENNCLMIIELYAF